MMTTYREKWCSQAPFRLLLFLASSFTSERYASHCPTSLPPAIHDMVFVQAQDYLQSAVVIFPYPPPSSEPTLVLLLGFKPCRAYFSDEEDENGSELHHIFIYPSRNMPEVQIGLSCSKTKLIGLEQVWSTTVG